MPDDFPSRRRREIREEGAAVPFTFEELRQAAREVLSDDAFRLLSAGAGTGDAKRGNREGFDRWRIVPRVFRGPQDRSLEVGLFGRTLPAPLVAAPIGGQTAYHTQGELASARGAASLGLPFSLSTVSSYSIEDVAAEIGDAPAFFQLYWLDDGEVTASLLERAERAGYDAILLTVDFQAPRWIPETLTGTDYGPFDGANPHVASDPVAEREGFSIDGPDAWDNSVTWEDLGFLHEHTDLPIVVKGISHPEDARLAIEHGADGIVVSNHGGRQIDRGVATITALPRVANAIDGRIPVLFDGGVRSGADAFVALALGADAVCVGRPYVYGLALEGERGVYEVLHNLLAELESVLALAGYDEVRDVDRSAVTDVGRRSFDEAG